MPAPWSPAMFAGEIAKPTSVCLGAWEADHGSARRLRDRVAVCRRVARDEPRRRRGEATGAAASRRQLLDERVRADPRRGRAAGSRSRCGRRTTPRCSCTRRWVFAAQGVRRGYYTDNREDAVIMWRDAVAGASAVILGLETSCDETAAAARHPRRRRARQRRRVAGGAPRAVRRRRAGGGGEAPSRARHARGRGRRFDDADATLDNVELVAVTRGPGLVGALLVGLSAAKALAWGRSPPARAGRPPARTRRVALPPARPGRAALRLPARDRRPHDGARRDGVTTATRCSADARRRGR